MFLYYDEFFLSLQKKSDKKGDLNSESYDILLKFLLAPYYCGDI